MGCLFSWTSLEKGLLEAYYLYVCVCVCLPAGSLSREGVPPKTNKQVILMGILELL